MFDLYHRELLRKRPRLGTFFIQSIMGIYAYSNKMEADYSPFVPEL